MIKSRMSTKPGPAQMASPIRPVANLASCWSSCRRPPGPADRSLPSPTLPGCFGDAHWHRPACLPAGPPGRNWLALFSIHPWFGGGHWTVSSSRQRPHRGKTARDLSAGRALQLPVTTGILPAPRLPPLPEQAVAAGGSPSSTGPAPGGSARQYTREVVAEVAGSRPFSIPMGYPGHTGICRRPGEDQVWKLPERSPPT